MTTPRTAGITRPDPASRYAGPRTAVTRPPGHGPGAPSRTAAGPAFVLHLTYAGAATAARAREDLVTDAAGQIETATNPVVPTRIVDGRLCTNRAGIAHLAGWKPGNSVNVRASTDPDFPPAVKVGREYWYPFDGRRGVDAYLALLAQRAQDKKPPAVKPGDPDDELHGEDAADALHIEYATLRSYVRYSVPYWKGEKEGRPLLPPPDVEEEREHERLGPYTYRAWRRSTLADHQAQRPGPGTGAGRPSSSDRDGSTQT